MTNQPSTIISAAEARPYDLIRAVSAPTRLPAGYPQTTVNIDVQLELLHRPNPKPPIGTVLTGQQVKSRAWKRGTKFCYVKRGTLTAEDRLHYVQTAPLYTIVFLTADGQFAYRVNNAEDRIRLTDDSEWILVYRPQEEYEHGVARQTEEPASITEELTGAQVNSRTWLEGTELVCTYDATPEDDGDNAGDVFVRVRGGWRLNGVQMELNATDRFLILD